MHHRPPLEEKLSFPPMAAFAGVNSGGNPMIYGRERKVQLIMFTYLTKFSKFSEFSEQLGKYQQPGFSKKEPGFFTANSALQTKKLIYSNLCCYYTNLSIDPCRDLGQPCPYHTS